MMKILFALICFSVAASEPTAEQLDLMRQYHLTVPPVILDASGHDKNLVRAEILDPVYPAKHIDVELPLAEAVELPLKPRTTSATEVSTINDSNFATETAEHGVVFVDFYADWCPPCRIMAKEIEALSRELLNVKFKKVDVSTSPQSPKTAGVYSLPAYAVYVDGRLSAVRTGFAGQTELRRWIEISSNTQMSTQGQESVYVPRITAVSKSRVNARGSFRAGW